ARHVPGQDRAAAWRRAHGEPAADRRDAIAHPGDSARLTDGVRGESGAAVGDRKLEAAVAPAVERDLRAHTGTAVLRRILKPLEAAEIDGGLDLTGKPWTAPDVEGDVQGRHASD